MDPKEILKQMLQFNKSIYDNSCKTMTILYEQNEAIIESSIKQSEWVPEEGRKPIKDWMGTFRAGCDEFKKIMDSQYEKVKTLVEDE